MALRLKFETTCAEHEGDSSLCFTHLPKLEDKKTAVIEYNTTDKLYRRKTDRAMNKRGTLFSWSIYEDFNKYTFWLHSYICTTVKDVSFDLALSDGAKCKFL